MENVRFIPTNLAMDFLEQFQRKEIARIRGMEESERSTEEQDTLKCFNEDFQDFEKSIAKEGLLEALAMLKHLAHFVPQKVSSNILDAVNSVQEAVLETEFSDLTTFFDRRENSQQIEIDSAVMMGHFANPEPESKVVSLDAYRKVRSETAKSMTQFKTASGGDSSSGDAC